MHLVHAICRERIDGARSARSVCSVRSAQGVLTAATNTAWGSLRRHVAAGCLCDPPGIDLNSYGATMSVGGDDFQSVASMRGSSALEGFHSHQKGWLGQRAIHSVEAGEALLRDGAVRWNRRRSGELNHVYDPQLLRELDEPNNAPYDSNKSPSPHPHALHISAVFPNDLISRSQR